MNKIEFENIILSDDFINECLKEEVKNKLFSIDPLVKETDGFQQRNPHHCYNLFEHTIRTVKNIDCSDLSDEEIRILKVAAFFHDIGKPDSAIEKPDRLVFYGHPKKSAEIAEPILCKLGYSDEEINRILFYIRNHDMFISFVLPEDNYDPNNVFLKVVCAPNVSEAIAAISRKESDLNPKTKDFLLLLRLCEADAKSQSKLVYNSAGKLIDSMVHKLEIFSRITYIIKEIMLQD